MAEERENVNDEIAKMLGTTPEEEDDAEDQEQATDGEEDGADGGEGDDEPVGDEEGEEDAEVEDEEELEEEEVDEDEDAEEEEEAEDEEEDNATVSALQRQVTALQAQLEKLSGAPMRPAEPEKPVEEDAPTLGPLGLEISDEEFEAAVSSKEDFVALLQKFGEVLYGRNYETALKRLPGIISREVSRESAHQQMVVDFYEANPELRGARRFVAFTFEQVLAEHPEMDYPGVFAETATRVKKSLGLLKTGGGRRSRRGRRGAGRTAPSAPVRSGRRTTTTPARPAAIADEIAAMGRVR